MPRNVRNWWLELQIDGKQERILVRRTRHPHQDGAVNS